MFRPASFYHKSLRAFSMPYVKDAFSGCVGDPLLERFGPTLGWTLRFRDVSSFSFSTFSWNEWPQPGLSLMGSLICCAQSKTCSRRAPTLRRGLA